MLFRVVGLVQNAKGICEFSDLASFLSSPTDHYLVTIELLGRSAFVNTVCFIESCVAFVGVLLVDAGQLYEE